MLRYDMLAAAEIAVCMLLHLVFLTWHSAPPEECIIFIFNDSTVQLRLALMAQLPAASRIENEAEKRICLLLVVRQ